MREAVEPAASTDVEAADPVRRAHRVAIVSHVNPDADAIGSMLGLAGGFRAVGKDVVTALSDRVPDYTRFLAGSSSIVSSLPAGPFDLYVFADSADIDRIGALYLDDPARFQGAPLLNIDHHRTNPLYGSVNYVDPAASSTSELSYRLLHALGAPLEADTATALLFGIVGDTGSFRNGATTPSSLEVAAELLAGGADQQQIAFQLFERKRFVAARLWGQIVSTIELDAERHIVFGYVSQEMMQREGAASDETEGIVEYLRGIEEAEVVVLLKESETGEIRVSMRSRPGVDVARIASYLGGGGHRQAAGCTLPGPVSQARRALTAAYDHLYPR